MSRSAGAAPPIEPDAPPKGSIGGEPILPDPVVVGGIDAKAVDQTIEAQMGEINKCWEDQRANKPGLAGKVLVKLIISKDGSVASTSTKSTSLRHAATEDCVNGALAKAKFPALQRGKTAIVSYPFVFPPL